MTKIIVTETAEKENNLLYVQTSLSELLKRRESVASVKSRDNYSRLSVDTEDYYSGIVNAEICDKLSEIVAVNYKYRYFKKNIAIKGLSETEKEILYASLIAADFEEDKKYVFERLKGYTDITLEGIYNFRLQLLKKKWKEIVDCMPACFVNSQMVDFIGFLLENKTKRVYVDGGRVYDSHYRRLNRCALLDGEDVRIIREVILSSAGEAEIFGSIPPEDEKYFKLLYKDKIFFSSGYFC